MIKNYITTALRNLIRNKGITAINIFGLATGTAICILITMYVGHEWSFDRFHEKVDRIYRLNIREIRQGNISQFSSISPAMGADIKARLPEVESIVRFMNFGGDFRYLNKTVTDYQLQIADSALWDICSFKLFKGDSKTALVEPFSIVLSESLAKKIFGDENPIGKTLDYNNGSGTFKVTGVVEDAPMNTALQYSGFVSFQTLYSLKTGTLTEWDGNFSFQTFLLVSKDFNLVSFSKKIVAIADEIINPKLSKYNVRYEPTLQPLKDIHLYSNFEYEKGVVKTLYIFIAVALFILFIAGFNFVNLSTAQSSKRAKEVGIRIISGSSRNQIKLQHLGETILLCIVSGLLALLLVEMLMPIYNSILGLRLNLYQPSFWWLQLTLPIFIVLFGILAGLYPAFYLTSMNPINIMKSALSNRGGKSYIRNTLVTIQFTISTILIICTSIIFLQLRHLQTKDLGINTNNLLGISVSGKNSWQRVEILKDELSKIPEIESTSYATQIAGSGFTTNGYRVEGVEDPVMIHALGVSNDYVRNLGIQIVNGRNLSSELSTDSNSVLINETLVKQMGWTDPIGKTITREKKFKVIGVIKDFHYESMHSPIRPLIMFLPFDDLKSYWEPLIQIRMKEGNINSTLSKIENVWNKTQPGYQMNYGFVSDLYKNHYQTEKRFGELFIYFTMLAIIISCLGLLGLANFNMKTRIREVSVRKVMGSSTLDIIRNFSIDFTKWPLFANLFAWPIAWYLTEMILNIYPYRIAMPWWVFIVTGILLYSISILTIIYQTYKTARVNPAETLKYE